MHGAALGLFSQKPCLQLPPHAKPCHVNSIQCSNRSISSFPYALWVEMIPESNNWSIYSRVGCAAYRYLYWRDFGFLFLAHWHFHPSFSMSFISVFGDIVWLDREKTQICWTRILTAIPLWTCISPCLFSMHSRQVYNSVWEQVFLFQWKKLKQFSAHTDKAFFFQKLVTNYGKSWEKKNIYHLLNIYLNL